MAHYVSVFLYDGPAHGQVATVEGLHPPTWYEVAFIRRPDISGLWDYKDLDDKEILLESRIERAVYQLVTATLHNGRKVELYAFERVAGDLDRKS